MLEMRHLEVENRHIGLDKAVGTNRYAPIGNFCHLGDRAMPKFNTTFELSVSDLDLIETALRASKLAKTQADLKRQTQDDDVREIHDLLGRLHNQKTFYRPAKGPYVSG